MANDIYLKMVKERLQIAICEKERGKSDIKNRETTSCGVGSHKR